MCVRDRHRTGQNGDSGRGRSRSQGCAGWSRASLTCTGGGRGRGRGRGLGITGFATGAGRGGGRASRRRPRRQLGVANPRRQRQPQTQWIAAAAEPHGRTVRRPTRLRCAQRAVLVGDWRPSLAICLPEGERSRGLRGCGKGRFVALFGVRLVVAGLGVVFVQIVCWCLAWRWAGLEEGPLYGLV